MIDIPFDFSTRPNYKRVKRVLSFCHEIIPFTGGTNLEGKEVPIKMLQDIFGPNCSELSVWLREQLLVVTKNYGVNIKRCNAYMINKRVWSELNDYFQTIPNPDDNKEKAKQRKKYAVSCKKVDYGVEYDNLISLFPMLSNKQAMQLLSGEFKYDRGKNNNRYLNNLQLIKTELREQIFASVGYIHNYDFDACAPTIFFQLIQPDNIFQYDAIQDYLNNKQVYRDLVWNIIKSPLDIEPEEIIARKKSAKKIINSLFNGAKLIKSPYCSIFRACDENEDKVEQLINEPKISALIFDIKNGWRRLNKRKEIEEREKKDIMKDLQKNFYTSGKQRWGLYYYYEVMLIEIVMKYLDKNNIKYFLEHDGFRCDKEVRVNDVIEIIKCETELEMKLKYKKVRV